jgi:collagenase-like PrtC family protease
MAVDLVPELIKAGVKSFKIEGRLKGPEYVAITTKAYREAVDAAWAQLGDQPSADESAGDISPYRLSKEMRNELAQVLYIS